ncbi:hypothetical protein BC939DRAFT_381238, partial [Gamsiella multidivaricata]|uniref:uncharacterized protein n=1 Tax=Gamsiella multidivaricata TaxID=101098 RepID=UPI002220E176
IHVATSHGHSIDVNYNPNDTIRQVKMKVYARLWIHPDIQKIFLGDRELGDDKILGDHKIQSGSALSIAPYHSGG